MNEFQPEVKSTTDSKIQRPAIVKWACLIMLLYLVASFVRIAVTEQIPVTSDLLWIFSLSELICLLVIVAIYFGSWVARGLLFFFALFNAGAAIVVGITYSTRIMPDSASTWLNLAFDVVCLLAVFLLFTPSARVWFQSKKKSTNP